jgi:hypothetical protein
MAYLTKAIAKADWLRIESDTSMDNMIDRFIADAEKEITGILNQPVEAEATTLIWYGSGQQQHNLYYGVPVTATALKYRDDPRDAYTTIDPSEYVVRNFVYGVALWYADGYMPGREYQFTATVGWSAANVPADITSCGYELVKELFYETPFAGQSERFGVSAITEGQGGTTFSKAIQRMRPIIAEKLAHYRRFTI